MNKRNIVIGFAVSGFVLLLAIVIGFAVWLGPHQIRRICLEVTETPAPAVISSTNKVKSSYIQLEYPENWTIDVDHPSYNLDTNFCIDAKGQGKVLVYTDSTGIALEDRFKLVLGQLSKLMSAPKLTPFDLWGVHKGTGVESRGLFLGVDSQTCIRCFGIAGTEATVIIVEIREDSHEQNNKPGYDLISQTFKFVSPI
jgi:hypothetical protein